MYNFTTENWKNIKGFEGLYQVSSLGRVWDKRNGKYLAERHHNSGYRTVMLKKGNRISCCYVHRLVAEAFKENPDPEHKTQVNHLNEDKTDNRAINLSWCTPKENIEYGTAKERAKESRGKRDKKIIMLDTGEVFNNVAELSKRYNIPRSSIIGCLKGYQNTAFGYEIMYLEDFKRGNKEIFKQIKFDEGGN